MKYVSLKKTYNKRIYEPSKYEVNKKFSGRKIVREIYQYLFEVMVHNKFLKETYEEVEIVTFDYSHEKMKLASASVANLINNYEYDYNIRVQPYTHVIVCGEDDFFDMVQERGSDSPMFYAEQPFPLDIMRNGKFQGFHLHVCPGISGVMILPKKVIEK